MVNTPFVHCQIERDCTIQLENSLVFLLFKLKKTIGRSTLSSQCGKLCVFQVIHFFIRNSTDFKMTIDFNAVAYSQTDALYRWNDERQIVIASGMKMSQFDLVSTPVSNYTLTFKHGILYHNSKNFNNSTDIQTATGNYSMISVRFNLHRHMGSFLIQVYGPCILLVVLSWVSFWLNREATADRVSLGNQKLTTHCTTEFSPNLKYLIFTTVKGVTTVLTMTFLGLEARANLPKVNYPTALDHFIFLSFGFIFATIVQVGQTSTTT